MKRAIYPALLLTCLLALPAAAQLQITRGVVGSGAAALAGAQNRLHGTVGQSAIGLLSQGASQHMVGFWYLPVTASVEPVHDVGSYSLLATNSMHLRSRSHVLDGNVGVNKRNGRRPFLAERIELVVGTHVQTEAGVEVSAASVKVKNRAQVKGTLHYLNRLDVHRRATVADPVQEGRDFWPLVTLPEFKKARRGDIDVKVKAKKTQTISPADGPFRKITVGNKGTLVFAGGEYRIGSLTLGNEAKAVFLAPTTLLIAGKMATGSKSQFGPQADSGVAPSEIKVYVRGYNGKHKKVRVQGRRVDDGDGGDDDDWEGMAREVHTRISKSPKAVKVGTRAVIQANVYARNGTIRLANHVEAKGAFIARTIDLGSQAKVEFDSGWEEAAPAPPATKRVLAKRQVEQQARPDGFGLEQNFPNPFNPTTSIRYSLTEMADVQLTVYNMLGQQVRVLVQRAQPAGAHLVEWDGRDASGMSVSSGIYFYRLQAGNERAVRKMTLAR